MALANNFSQMIAIFCLVLFYSVFKKELKPLHPIRQFMCIKAVVFATFWQVNKWRKLYISNSINIVFFSSFYLRICRQSVLLAILVKFQIISPKEWPYFPTLTDTVNGLQVSCLFFVVFNYLPKFYCNGESERTSYCVRWGEGFIFFTSRTLVHVLQIFEHKWALNELWLRFISTVMRNCEFVS